MAGEFTRYTQGDKGMSELASFNVPGRISSGTGVVGYSKQIVHETPTGSGLLANQDEYKTVSEYLETIAGLVTNSASETLIIAGTNDSDFSDEIESKKDNYADGQIVMVSNGDRYILYKITKSGQTTTATQILDSTSAGLDSLKQLFLEKVPAGSERAGWLYTKSGGEIDPSTIRGNTDDCLKYVESPSRSGKLFMMAQDYTETINNSSVTLKRGHIYWYDATLEAYHEFNSHTDAFLKNIACVKNTAAIDDLTFTLVIPKITTDTEDKNITTECYIDTNPSDTLNSFDKAYNVATVDTETLLHS